VSIAIGINKARRQILKYAVIGQVIAIGRAVPLCNQASGLNRIIQNTMGITFRRLGIPGPQAGCFRDTATRQALLGDGSYAKLKQRFAVRHLLLLQVRSSSPQSCE
jgi:hypothetical protein